jgi:hypothetical protein
VNFSSVAAPHLTVAALHKNVPSTTRAAVVSEWFDGGVDVVVATDLAARGLDTTHVSGASGPGPAGMAHCRGVLIQCPRELPWHIDLAPTSTAVAY